MIDQTQSADVAVNNLLRMVANQVTNLQGMIETHSVLVDEALQGEIDQYNNLVDTTEKIENEKLNLELKIIELNKTIDDNKLAYDEDLNKLQREIDAIRVRTRDYIQIKDELKKLKALNPDRLKKKLKEKTTVAEERLNAVMALRRENSQYRLEKVELEKHNSDLINKALQLEERANDLESRLTKVDGDVIKKVFEGKNGLECYIYVYGWNLVYLPRDNSIDVVNDMEFHVVIRTNWAINLTISLTKWLVPFMPTCQDLEGLMPDNLLSEIQNLYYEHLQDSHDYLIERVEWAKSVDLSSCTDALTEREISLLAESNFYSIYSVMHSTNDEMAKRVKGVSNKTAQKIRASIYQHYVKPWESQNWTREQRGLN